MDVTSTKIQRQIELEEAARALAYSKGQAIVQDAIDTGRYPDLPVGRRLLAAGYSVTQEALEKALATRTAGLGGKYKALLRRIPVETLSALGMRYMLSAATHPQQSRSRLQSILTELGKAIESEAMVCCIEKAAPVYLERTLGYLDRGHTKSINHRYRTFLAAAETTIRTWEAWSPQERHGAAKLLMQAVFDTGLFEWATENVERGMKHLLPSATLQEHLHEVQEHAVPILRHDPMVVPPEPWTGLGAGGYLTPWMRVNSPMLSVRHLRGADRDWVLQNLTPESVVVQAMNKAQATPYRVNYKVLEVLRKAIVIEEGSMGLPHHGQSQRPEFPLPETWEKATASAEELETFQQWKRQVAEWYSELARRRQTKRSISLALSTLTRFQEESELYFPTYLDYRGRVYFRGSVHPQSHDAIKACLELAKGEPLGEHGLFWLKVHVASCAGYDKADFPLRAAWTEENWPSILAWLESPVDQEAPEPDTAFSLYAAATALQEALACPDPREYVCHVPVAMDATCSGLQHLSAMFRDEVGAEFTNLFDSGGTEKRDIYMRVAEVAQGAVSYDDPVVQRYWQDKPITRSMSKRPVMTFCYGSTLKSCIDYVCDGLVAGGAEPIQSEAGQVLYSLHKLAVPVAKALRAGVVETVPAAAAAMDYFQALARRCTEPLRWVTPAGMPVMNYIEGEHDKLVRIRSMGVEGVLIRQRDGKYNPRKAAAAISPNIVHSLDAAHLCMVLTAADFHIVPIHDSFAALPSRVPELHRHLREQFLELYQNDVLPQLQQVPLKSDDVPVPPARGTLDIRRVLDSRFVFC